jgi:benzylsuccinate CoA-transferase BbsF subunit
VTTREAPEEPLSGLRVIEISQGIAAPSCARYLSAHGAEVLKIESPLKPDITRLYAASWLTGSDHSAEVLMDTSPLVSEFLAGKLSVGLNLASNRGHELLMRLVELSDVFLVNLSTHATSALNLEYEDVAGRREDIIYLSLPAFGNTPSRYRDYRAWGPNLAPLAGIDHLTGWPDRPPSGISGFAYPDYVNAGNATIAVLSALLLRDLTGQGSCIDFSQYESCITVLGPAVLDYTANGVVETRSGNQVPWAAPHGVYPTIGRDRWVAIACETDEQWQGLCRVAEGEAFASHQGLRTTAARIEHADELDEMIARWTSGWTAPELAERLQREGVIAAPVEDIAALLVDPQLEARGFYRMEPQHRFGAELFIGYPPKLSLTPPQNKRGGACLGEHTASVLERLLGISAEERATLLADGDIWELAEPEQTFRRPYIPWARELAPTLRWPAPTHEPEFGGP